MQSILALSTATSAILLWLNLRVKKTRTRFVWPKTKMKRNEENDFNFYFLVWILDSAQSYDANCHLIFLSMRRPAMRKANQRESIKKTLKIPFELLTRSLRPNVEILHSSPSVVDDFQTVESMPTYAKLKEEKRPRADRKWFYDNGLFDCTQCA